MVFLNYLLLNTFLVDLNKLNEVSHIRRKETIKLKDLPENAPHPILSVKIVTTKFGRSVLVELEQYTVFLPKRIVASVEENIENFIPKKYSLIFKGLVDCNKVNPASNFEIVENL